LSIDKHKIYALFHTNISCTIN